MSRLWPWILSFVLVGCAGGVCYLYSGWLDNNIATMRDDVKGWDDKITLIKGDIPMITKAREEPKAIQHLLDFLGAVEKDDTHVMAILTGVEHARPREVTMSDVYWDAHALKIQACATGSLGARALVQFYQALSRSPMCQKVQSSQWQTTPGQTGGVQLHMEMVCRT